MALYTFQRTPTGAAVSAAGNNTVGAWIPLNPNQAPFSVGFGTRTNGGPFTYSVEHTFDDIYDTAVSAVAFRHSEVSLRTSAADGNYAFPVRAVRVAIGTVAVSGNLIFQVIQAGY